MCGIRWRHVWKSDERQTSWSREVENRKFQEPSSDICQAGPKSLYVVHSGMAGLSMCGSLTTESASFSACAKRQMYTGTKSAISPVLTQQSFPPFLHSDPSQPNQSRTETRARPKTFNVRQDWQSFGSALGQAHFCHDVGSQHFVKSTSMLQASCNSGLCTAACVEMFEIDKPFATMQCKAVLLLQARDHRCNGLEVRSAWSPITAKKEVETSRCTA